MNIYIISLFVSLLQLTRSEIHMCGEGYYYIHCGEETVTHVCDLAPGEYVVDPPFPDGLSFSSGVVFGSAVSPATLTKYVVRNDTFLGCFWLTVTEQLSFISVGFSSRFYPLNTTLFPIILHTDSFISDIHFSPDLPPGLSFNAQTRMITGKFDYPSEYTEYFVIARYKNLTVSTSFAMSTIHAAPSHIIDACYYPLEDREGVYPLEWYFTTPASLCRSHSRIDFIESYASTKVHTWEGLDSRFGTVFTASFTGYLSIPQREKYMFHVISSGGFRLYVGDLSIPILNEYSESPSTISIKSDWVSLDQGKQPFLLIYSNFCEIAQLHVYYATESYPFFKLVDSELLFGAGVPPQFLSFDNIVGFRGYSIPSNPPKYSGSQCSYFSLNSSLPSGLSFDPSTGSIFGSLSYPVNEWYTLYCYSYYGDTETTFLVLGDYTPLDGLRTKYYTIGLDNVCNFTNSITKNIDLLVDKVSESIKIEDASSLPSLPVTSQHLFIEWEGLFRPTYTGNYLFRVDYVNGMRLWINDTVVAEDWICSSERHHSVVSLHLDYGSYVSLRMHYFTPSIASIFIVLSVIMSSGVPILNPGNGFFYFLPSAPLSYSKQQSIYYLGDDFDVNKHLTFGLTYPITSFSVSPSLPEGLTLTGGNIVGKVTVTLPENVFTVKGVTSRGDVYTSLVTISIYKVEPPSDLHLIDDDGKVVANVSLHRYMFIPTLYLVCEGVVDSWFVSPTLPKDLSFDYEKGVISGRVITAGSFAVTISGRNKGGVASTILYIESLGCEFGSFFYTSLNSGSSGWLVFYNNTDTVVNSLIPSGDYGVVMCIPLTTYNLKFNCTQSESDCIFRIIREDGTVFFRSVVLYHNLLKSVVNLKESSKPSITTPYSTLYVSVDSFFIVLFTVSNSYSTFNFAPKLPSCLSFDEEKLQISGRITSTGIYRYTISSYNDIGGGKLEIAMFVGMCPDQEYLIVMNRVSSRLGESFEIIQDNESVFKYIFKSSPFGYMLCINRGEYTVVLNDSYDRGWVTGSDLVITDQKNRLLGTFLLETGGRQEYSFPFIEMVQEQEAVKCLVSTLAPIQSWNYPNFDDSFWPLRVSSQTVIMPGGLATVYFRKHVVLSSMYTTFLTISVFIQEGLVVYYQGVELGRVNVPSGTIYHSTTAIQSFDEPHWLSYVAMRPDLIEEVVISVELHRRRVVSTDNVVFDIHITPLTTYSVFQSINPLIQASNHTVYPDHPPAAAFDGNVDTSWMDTSFPVWISASASTQEHFIVNRIDIQIGKDWNWCVPKGLSVLGFDECGKATVLYNVSSSVLFPYSYSTHSIYFNNYYHFSRYQVVVSSVMSGEAALLTSVAFYFSLTRTCQSADEWPSTPAGSTVYLDCTKNRIGKRWRQCVPSGNSGVWSDVNETGCVDQYPKRKEVYVDFTLKVTNCSLVLWRKQIEAIAVRVLLRLTQQPSHLLVKIVDFESNDSTFVTTAFFRFILGSASAESAKNSLEEARSSLTKLIYRENEVPVGLQFTFDGKITLERWRRGLILLFLFIGLLLTYIMYRVIYWWWNHRHVRFSEDKNYVTSSSVLRFC